MLTKIGERLAVKTRDDCSEEFTVEELDDGLSRMTVKRSTDNASSWCCTQQFKFPGMTELEVVDEDDTVDDFDELDAGAAASITIVCYGLSKGNFLFVTDGASHVHSLHLGESVRSWTSLLPRLLIWQEEKKDAGHRRKSANADRDQQQVVKPSRDVSKHSDCLNHQ